MYLDQFAVPPAAARTAGLVHGFLLDITEQKELEHALEQERQRLESILEVSPTPIATLDSSGRVTSWGRSPSRYEREQRALDGALSSRSVTREPRPGPAAAVISAAG